MIKNRLSKFLDGFYLAWLGLRMACKTFQFWRNLIIAFLIFGTLMNLLSNGFSSFQLMGAVGFLGSLEIIFDAFLKLFGVNATFSDWIFVFCISLLQSVLISLVFFARKRQKQKSSENLERAGIVTGLAILGSGCPTCGTALLAPVVGMIFSGGGAIVGAISWIITAIAIVIAVFSIRKIGKDIYVIMMSEKRKKEVKKKDGKSD